MTASALPPERTPDTAQRCYRQAGVSEQDCERLAGAFVYEGLLI
ncbi:hypothetical protein [Cyanobium sp. WKJ7-Wakatipu]|nr:hypothetical protein [Cyanobium sp. WKJ7-Wakatipu]